MSWRCHAEMLEEVHNFLETGTLTDMAISVEDNGTIHTIRCHRLVVSSCSAFLARILTEDAKSSELEEASITLADTTQQQMRQLISYLYTGSVSLDSQIERDALAATMTSLGVQFELDTATTNLPANLPIPSSSSSSSSSYVQQQQPAICSGDLLLLKAVTMMHGDSPSPSVSQGTGTGDKNEGSSPLNAPGSQFADNDGEGGSNLPCWSSWTGGAANESCCWQNPSSYKTDLFGTQQSPNAGHVAYQNNCDNNSQVSSSSLLSTVDKSAILYTFPDNYVVDKEDLLTSSVGCCSPSSSSSCKENESGGNADWVDLNINETTLLFDLPIEQPSSSSPHQHNVKEFQEKNQSANNQTNTRRRKERNKSSAATLHPCSQCQKSFPSRHYLKFHERSVHSTKKTAECHLCSKIFTGPYYLRQHLRRMHAESRAHVCPHCDAAFAVKYDLVVHLRTHAAVKRHACADCGNTYATSRALREHRRTHTGERPFQCGECGRRFALPKTLRVHYRQHSGERPYLCSKCGRTFVQNSTLRNHLKNNHKGEYVKKAAVAC